MVLVEGERRHLIYPLEQMKKVMGCDLSKCCRYHKAWGHDFEECRNLKFEIERLTKVGHVQEYVKKVEECQSTLHCNRDYAPCTHPSSPKTEERTRHLEPCDDAKGRE